LNNGTFNSNKIYSNQYVGLQLDAVGLNMTLNLLNVFRNTIGIELQGNLAPAFLAITNCTANNNSIAHVGVSDSFIGRLIISDATFANGGSAVQFAANCTDVLIKNSDLGSTGTYTNGDISASADCEIVVSCRNCKFSTNPVTSTTQGHLLYESRIGSDRHNQTAGLYKLWQSGGTSEVDTSTFVTPTVSERITPNGEIKVGGFRTYVKSGDELYVSILMKKSADFVGDQPQLILRSNPAIGYNDDVVLAEASTLSDSAWELVNGQLPVATATGIATIAVRTNGTAGHVNIDEFITSRNNVEDGNMEVGYRGMPIARLGNTRSKGNVPNYTGTFTLRTTISNIASPQTLLLGYSQSNATLEVLEASGLL
jgi:hypothetical protein